MCNNTVSYWLPHGYDYKEYEVKCGNTDPYGGRALCEECEKNSSALAEHNRIIKNSEADNAWLKSAGWGEM